MPTNIQMLEHEMRDRLIEKNKDIDRICADNAAKDARIAELEAKYEQSILGLTLSEELNREASKCIDIERARAEKAEAVVEGQMRYYNLLLSKAEADCKRAEAALRAANNYPVDSESASYAETLALSIIHAGHADEHDDLTILASQFLAAQTALKSEQSVHALCAQQRDDFRSEKHRAEAEGDALRPPLADLINLVESIVNNDPDDLVADGGMTVLDAVRASADWMLKRARAALHPPPTKEKQMSLNLNDSQIRQLKAELDQANSELEEMNAIHLRAQRAEAERDALRGLLQEARDHIGSMPTIGSDGADTFFKTLKIVEKLEAALAPSPAGREG